MWADCVVLWQERKAGLKQSTQSQELDELLKATQLVIKEFLEYEEQLKKYLEHVTKKGSPRLLMAVARKNHARAYPGNVRFLTGIIEDFQARAEKLAVLYRTYAAGFQEVKRRTRQGKTNSSPRVCESKRKFRRIWAAFSKA